MQKKELMRLYLDENENFQVEIKASDDDVILGLAGVISDDFVHSKPQPFLMMFAVVSHFLARFDTKLLEDFVTNLRKAYKDFHPRYQEFKEVIRRKAADKNKKAN